MTYVLVFALGATFGFIVAAILAAAAEDKRQATDRPIPPMREARNPGPCKWCGCVVVVNRGLPLSECGQCGYLIGTRYLP